MDSPLDMVIPGVMEAWRNPTSPRAWGKAAVDIALTGTTLLKGAQVVSNLGKGSRAYLSQNQFGKVVGLIKTDMQPKLLSSSNGLLGHLNWELKNFKHQNTPRNTSKLIYDRIYSCHALDQMQNRGLMPSIVEHAIRNGQVFSTKNGTIGYYDTINNVRVIVNSKTGQVITAISGSP